MVLKDDIIGSVLENICFNGLACGRVNFKVDAGGPLKCERMTLCLGTLKMLVATSSEGMRATLFHNGTRDGKNSKGHLSLFYSFLLFFCTEIACKIGSIDRFHYFCIDANALHAMKASLY